MPAQMLILGGWEEKTRKLHSDHKTAIRCVHHTGCLLPVFWFSPAPLSFPGLQEKAVNFQNQKKQQHHFVWPETSKSGEGTKANLEPERKVGGSQIIQYFIGNKEDFAFYPSANGSYWRILREGVI